MLTLRARDRCKELIGSLTFVTLEYHAAFGAEIGGDGSASHIPVPGIDHNDAAARRQ